jgi:cell division protein FtsZ
MVATGLNGAVRVVNQSQSFKVMTTCVMVQLTNLSLLGWKLKIAPAVFTNNNRRAQVEAMKMSGVEEYDIPAFLRKQAD